MVSSALSPRECQAPTLSPRHISQENFYLPLTCQAPCCKVLPLLHELQRGCSFNLPFAKRFNFHAKSLNCTPGACSPSALQQHELWVIWVVGQSPCAGIRELCPVEDCTKPSRRRPRNPRKTSADFIKITTLRNWHQCWQTWQRGQRFNWPKD